MNRGLAENAFRTGVEELLATIARERAPDAVDPYAGAGDQTLHEHDTRIFFFDTLLSLLGWELGAGGNVVEEARIKAGTTKFVDYVGVNANTRAPALILEAKAWDKPIITGKGDWVGKTKAELIVAAIKHLKAGGSRGEAPVAGEWHDYLEQLAGYVCTFKDNYGHSVPSAVLASGQWLVIFTAPVATFCDASFNDGQFLLIELRDYVAQAHLIFERMARVALADTAPQRIYSSQLPNYVTPNNLKAAYHGLLVRYEKSGAPQIGQLPRILLYPALFVERDDHALFTVIDASAPILLQKTRLENGEEVLGPHIDEVAAAARALLQSCSAELGISITPGPCNAFRGFPAPSVVAASGLSLGQPQKLFVRPMRATSDQWLAVTGDLPHYLLADPVLACRFHSWSECHASNHAIGASAVGSPSIEAPRALFADTMAHHCAHRVVDHRRENRCHIRPIDSRTCCRACAYQDICWSAAEAAALPCGK
ncbi:hypothetical protein B5V01_08075 [Mesorhizobium erdmanii]|uniref:Uncharacterized protein n=2 Tax=Mesorhizobium TaxID=68287 RepID=A0A3M9X2Z4_9HYPH|nr:MULTISPECIES: hypothetical protein [Mesorhizobium]RNJ42407.1 hypothetical protein DNR46_28850 [Mesorhizobium japonicum]RXT47910.1 hypothetical protein B5V01_08075 [Mesorhizobium erdmanii]